MKALSYNQRNGGHRKALCPGAPQGPTWYHADLMIILMMQKRMTGWGRGKKGEKNKGLERVTNLRPLGCGRSGK